LKGRPLDPAVDDDEIRPPEAIAHPDLLAKPEDAIKPVAVQNGRMHGLYMSAGFERDKNKRKLVHLDFSIVLEEACAGLVPEKVREAATWMERTGNKLIEVRGLEPVTFDVFTDPRKARPLLHLVNAEFVRAIVSFREEVGKGKSREIERFAFRILVERTQDVIDFAGWNDGQEFWLCMPATQGKVPE